MASIRRTSSPVPRTNSGTEAVVVASPLSRSPSNYQYNLPTHNGGGGGVLPSSLGSSSDYPLHKAKNSSSLLKAQSWRRSILRFSMCFMIGVFLGLTPFAPINLSPNLMPNDDKKQAFNFGVGHIKARGLDRSSDEVSAREGFSSSNESSSSEPHGAKFELKEDRIIENGSAFDNKEYSTAASVSRKLVIVVTPTRARPLQAYYLTRLAHTLRLVPNPLLWVVVEMKSQSMETAELLRRTGVSYRHLACGHKNTTEVMDKDAMMRNLALMHIETHRLDGIVFFADDDVAYSFALFQQMRQISRFGTWAVAKLAENQGNVVLEGPICNGTQVTGWHVAADVAERYRRFHADMSGFAFNSSIIWDPKRWHRPTLEAIRHIVAVKEDASAFIEQIVEDESQMECLCMGSSKIMAWNHRNTHSSSSRDDSIMGYYIYFKKYFPPIVIEL